MKKVFISLLLSALLAGFVSCEKQGKRIYRSPEKVTTEFVKAFYTGDFDNMYKFTMKKNHVIIKNLQDNLSEMKLEEVKKNKIEIQETACTFQNDSVAECTCKFLFNDNMNEIPFDLRKSEGKWLIDLSLN